MEKDLKKKIKNELIGHPIWEGFLKEIIGVGEVIGGSLIGEIDTVWIKNEKSPHYGKRSIDAFEQTSDLWAYAGLAVKNGLASRRKRGEGASWNKYLRLALHYFANQAVRQVRGDTIPPFRLMYEKRKEYEKEKHDKTCKGTYEKGKWVKCKAPKLHIELRTKRYIAKKLLSDLYHYWKENTNIVM